MMITDGFHRLLMILFSVCLGVFEFLKSYDTGSKLCVSVNSALVEKADSNVIIICLGFDDGTCTILETFKNKDDPNIEFRELISFQADFAEVDSCINCSQIFSNGTIATGGEDGICRLWRLSHNDEKWTVVKECTLSTHKSPISSINAHPFKPWVCVASRDGSIVVVNTDSFLVIGQAFSINGKAHTSVNYDLRTKSAIFLCCLPP
jgi:WD40 repeat protein